MQNFCPEYRTLSPHQMDDFSMVFKDIIVPIAPSILYERQGVLSPTLTKKKSASKRCAELFINIPAFIERGMVTSTVRRTPVATTGQVTLSSSTLAIVRRR